MAIQDLSTLTTLKQWLPVNSSNPTDDATLQRLLTAVSMDFQRATKRPDLLMANYTEVRDGDGSRRLILYHWPVIGVTSLKIGAATISASADKIANGYYFDADIDPERDFNLYLNGYAFTDGAAVQISYTSGYVQPGATPAAGQVALPGDVEQAVLDWCAYRYRERPNLGSTMLRTGGVHGDERQSPLIDAPPNVLQVIERYRRMVPALDRRQEEREEAQAGRAKRQSPKGKK